MTIVTQALECGAGHSRHPGRTLASAFLRLDAEDDKAARSAVIQRLLPGLELGPLEEHFLREVVDAGLSNAQRAVMAAIPEDRRSTKREAAVAALATLSGRLNSPLLVIEDARWADYMLTVAKRRPLIQTTLTNGRGSITHSHNLSSPPTR